MQEDVFTNTLFTLPLPPLTSLKEEAVLFKAELSPPLFFLPHVNFSELNNKSITVKILYYFYTLSAST